MTLNEIIEETKQHLLQDVREGHSQSGLMNMITVRFQEMQAKIDKMNEPRVAQPGECRGCFYVIGDKKICPFCLTENQ